MEPIKLTVRQLNMYVKSLLEGDANLSAVTLVGELSNFKNHYSSGHLYFVLKDSFASVKAVMFRANASRVNFVPCDGMTVVCRGYVSLYERDGQYQFYAESMLPFGQGDIALEFERIKQKLEGEGLFSNERKKAIPKIPKKVGVITSETGAAFQDIINISSRRFPLCNIILFPALVQGISAPKSLISALERAYKRNDLDIIIIGRGGGSAEDLSCFNDEGLARKIAESKIPVISAVGHETDFTIADYVADLRAPTPSAAAEIAFPLADELLNQIKITKQKISSNIFGLISDYNTDIQIILNKRCFKRPDQLFSPFELRLDRSLIALENSYCRLLQKNELKLSNAALKIEALSPSKILDRGYSVTYKGDKILKDSRDAVIGENLKIKLSKGLLKCTVCDVSEEN